MKYLKLSGRIALLRQLGEKACWPWPGAIRNGQGYGQTKRPGSRVPVGAHVAVYEELVGPVPAGLELDHTCNNRICVNPSHLEPVTHAENKRREQQRRLFCGNGHAFTPENTYTDPKRGVRACRECRKAAAARMNERLKAKRHADR